MRLCMRWVKGRLSNVDNSGGAAGSFWDTEPCSVAISAQVHTPHLALVVLLPGAPPARMASRTLRLRRQATATIPTDVFENLCGQVKEEVLLGAAAADALEKAAALETVWIARCDLQSVLEEIRCERVKGVEAEAMFRAAAFSADGRGDVGVLQEPEDAKASVESEQWSWEKAMHSLFSAADVDHSGTLDSQQFDRLVATTVKMTGAPLEGDLSKLDKNGDGKIDEQELQEFSEALKAAMGKRSQSTGTAKAVAKAVGLSAELDTLGEEVPRKLLELDGELTELKLLAEVAASDEALSKQVADILRDVGGSHEKLSALNVAEMKQISHMEDIDEMNKVCTAMAEDRDMVSMLLKDSTKTNGKVAELETLVAASESCGDAYTQHTKDRAMNLFKKGFSLRQLLTFVDEKCHKGRLIGTRTTTYEVVKNIIIPETASGKCCYADILPDGPKEPTTLMSHWWGNNFLHLVKAVCQHASGKTELFLHMYTEEELDKTFWLCIFGVNQHFSICHRQGCDCGAPKHHVGINCQMNKFALVMEHIPRHALAMDLELTTLKRVWVLSELNEAMSGGQEKTTVFCGVVGDAMRDEPVIPSVRQAEASFESDKALIIGEIEQREGGVERFDTEMRTRVLDEIAVLRAFFLASRGDTSAVQAELESRSFLLKRQSAHGRGETLLHTAVRYGYAEMVRMMLAWGADVHDTTLLGWTALHYAAVCFNPEKAMDIASMILEARADQGLENSAGRIPLEEAMCADPDTDGEVVKLLMSAGGRELKEEVTRALKDPLGDGPFMPHPIDTQLFSHWLLRMDSWTRPDVKIGIVQPIDGEIQVLSDWVKPIEFGTPAGEVVPSAHCKQLVIAAMRVRKYIQYRWPLWDFHTIVFRYTTPTKPQHYRVDLRTQSLSQIETSDMHAVKREMMDDFTVKSFVPASIRFLYP